MMPPPAISVWLPAAVSVAPVRVMAPAVAVSPRPAEAVTRLLSSDRSPSAVVAVKSPPLAASVAALTLYDMLKAHGKGMVIEQVRLLSKTGGKSGTWRGE